MVTLRGRPRLRFTGRGSLITKVVMPAFSKEEGEDEDLYSSKDKIVKGEKLAYVGKKEVLVGR